MTRSSFLTTDERTFEAAVCCACTSVSGVHPVEKDTQKSFLSLPFNLSKLPALKEPDRLRQSFATLLVPFDVRQIRRHLG